MSEKAPIVIMQGSKQPYLSIGRHYGGVKVWGHEYYYHPIKDAFIRKDFVKELKKHKDWDKFIEYIKTVKQ